MFVLSIIYQVGVTPIMLWFSSAYLTISEVAGKCGKREKPNKFSCAMKILFLSIFFLKKKYHLCERKQRCMGKYSQPSNLYWDLYRIRIKFFLSVF